MICASPPSPDTGRRATDGPMPGAVEQDRLSDAGLAADHHRRAWSFAQGADDSVESGTLTMPSDQLAHRHHERDPSRQVRVLPEVRRRAEYGS